MRTRTILVLFILMFSIMGCVKEDSAKPDAKAGNNADSDNGAIQGTEFRKDGELFIHASDGKLKAGFEIEVASSEQASLQGLMYRESMDVSQAMFFDPRGLANTPFWMKNTYIPLDIIFIDADEKIMHIVENTRPFSEERVYSNGIYRYVLEINAGLSEEYGLRIGDRIKWTKE